MTPEELQLDSLRRNVSLLIAQSRDLRARLEAQDREMSALRDRLCESSMALEREQKRSRRLLMARSFITDPVEMGDAKQRLAQMIQELDRCIALLELPKQQ